MSEAAEQLNEYLESWRNDSSRNNVITVLSNISELIEKETEAFYKMNPDPFDDRHPSRSKPTCTLGQLLKILFKQDEFLNKLVQEYIMERNNEEIQIVSSRLLIDILPAADSSVVFAETEGLMDRLFSWAHQGQEPLQSYATCLLAAAMEVPEMPQLFKERNFTLYPIMLKKLRSLMEEESERGHILNDDYSFETCETPTKRRRVSSPSNDCSNSSWAEMESFIIGSYKIHPLNSAVKQRFIFQYLHALGEYQELLSFVFEYQVLGLILRTIDLNITNDVRLVFEALKYLSSLLTHKKFALEFVNSGGIQVLLKIYRHSLAANGVSLCFNYLVYHEDVMEKVCFLPKNILNDLISYALWLIERSHESSRLHWMVFFSFAFQYKVILEIFDSQDGLRKILNEILILDLFSTNLAFTEEEIFSKRQYAKNICLALKKYFEMHLVLKSQSLIRSSSASTSNFSRLVEINFPPYKPIRCDYEFIMEHVEAMLQLVPIRCQWEPLDQLVKLGGAKLLIQYVSMCYDWNFNGKADAVRSALDVFVVCSTFPKFQQILTELIHVDNDTSLSGMRIILFAASGDMISDAECQRSALNIIINCVCGPVNRVGGSVVRLSNGTSSAKKKVIRGSEDLINKLWNRVRLSNGIMQLINLMQTKVPITDADSIRTLSCKALCGLARDENVRQVICKLPLFTNGQIQALMKEPILQDKRSEHLKFCRYCLELIERVTGTPVSSTMHDSIGNLNKAEVVTQTKIVFNEKELLQLIHNHLVQKGLTKTAQTLIDEASLTDLNNSNSLMKNMLKFSTPPRNAIRVSRQISSPNLSQLSIPQSLQQLKSSELNQSSSSQPNSSNSGLLLRINKPTKSNYQSDNHINNRRISSHFTTPIVKRKSDNACSNNISLDSIVKEYLRKQHSLCKNPAVTCPPFDLFKPHRCPEPMNRNMAPNNVTARLISRTVFPPFGGMFGSKMDRKFIYSRYKQLHCIKSPEDNQFISSAFSHSGNTLYVGSDNGEIYTFNTLTFLLEHTFTCRDQYSVRHIEPSWDNNFILTSSDWDQSNSFMWKITGSSLDQLMAFGMDSHVEFGKSSQDKVLGTCEFAAHLYDTRVKQMVRKFQDENYSNQYDKNIATFHPNDQLILNDGVLWDVRSKSPVHKFDKFNHLINGFFHPNGREIISSSEIWDIKTFKLLKTVPALNENFIKFNQNGDVIYGVMDNDMAMEKIDYGSSFRVFDGYDYSNIATIDVKRFVTALEVDPSDHFLALVENNLDNAIFHDSHVRLYGTGLCREEEDREEDDEDDDDEDEESSDDDSHPDFDNPDDDDDILDSESEFSPISDLDSEGDGVELMDEEDDNDIFYQLNL